MPTVSSFLSPAHLLREIGLRVRTHLATRRTLASEAAAVVAREGGDTIYAIDRAVEPLIAEAVAGWPAAMLPVMLTMEGLGHDGRQRFGPEGVPLRWHVMIDPIDGTRGLMYDKRAAWFLATAAPADGGTPTLASTTAAAMVELPTSKQGWADDFVADEAYALIGRRVDLASGRAMPLPVGPSSASGLEHGFAHVVSFFPGIHRLAADLTETIAASTTRALPGQAVVFNDQYISTGGQMVELMLGRDRFCSDLRPLFHDILRRQGMAPASAGLECHPYDMAGLLVARRAGVILTDGFGRDLDAPFDVISGVHWCGYANASIQSLVAPVLRDWLAQHGVAP